MMTIILIVSIIAALKNGNYDMIPVYLALKQGKKRFGSSCPHTKVRNGKCLNCFRKVIDNVHR